MGFAQDPISLSRKKKMTHEEIAEALRDDMEAELDAANLYIEQAALIDDDVVAAVLRDIAKEEKVHFGEFLSLLKGYDKEVGTSIDEGRQEVENWMQKLASSIKASRQMAVEVEEAG